MAGPNLISTNTGAVVTSSATETSVADDFELTWADFNSDMEAQHDDDYGSDPLLIHQQFETDENGNTVELFETFEWDDDEKAAMSDLGNFHVHLSHATGKYPPTVVSMLLEDIVEDLKSSAMLDEEIGKTGFYETGR